MTFLLSCSLGNAESVQMTGTCGETGPAYVGEIERGESNVTLQTLKNLADTLGVKVGDLVKGL